MKISKFQIITLAVFVICIVAGVATFALYKGKDRGTSLPPITVWGTFPANTFNKYVSDINNGLAQGVSISYVQKSADVFSSDFVNALARGTGPDAILITADSILSHKDKLTLVPYTALPQRAFMDSYIQEANIYLSEDGVLAIPFTIDPLVMYWNRDTFNVAGLATYPKYWDEFYSLSQKLTVKDQNGNIRKSAIAMGVFSNITNARELLGSLLLQSGNPVTALGRDGFFASTIKVGVSADPSPAIKYFTQFVDPSNANYSWNRAMPNDKSAFLSGVLTTYFGFASELAGIRDKNPNLNYDVAPLPQLRTGGQKTTYGRLYGFSFVRASAKANSAYEIVSILTKPQYLSSLSETMYLPTVMNELIAQGSTDPYISIFNQEALISKTWLDADPASSRQILSSVIESITSGKKTIQEALRDGGDQYDVILRKAVQ
jgi:ABC-type glycerol-3-phosphate transport system substrate-binding protein